MELLIMTVDRRLPRGAVVVAMPDWHPWSAAERDESFWRVVRVPGLLDVEAAGLAAPRTDGPRVLVDLEGVGSEMSRAELYRRAV